MDTLRNWYGAVGADANFKVAFSQAGRGLGPHTTQGKAFRQREGRRLAVCAAAQLLGREADDDGIALEHDGAGRPRVRVDGKLTDVDVSISHSGTCVVAAAVRGARIGVDVEPLADVPPPRVWRFFMSPDEAHACMPEPRRALWTWTIKEATFKALDAAAPLDFRRMEVHGWSTGPEVDLHDEPPARKPTVYLREHRGFALTVVVV